MRRQRRDYRRLVGGGREGRWMHGCGKGGARLMTSERAPTPDPRKPSVCGCLRRPAGDVSRPDGGRLGMGFCDRKRKGSHAFATLNANLIDGDGGGF